MNTKPIDLLLTEFVAAEAIDDLDRAKELLAAIYSRVDEIKEYSDRLYFEAERVSSYAKEFSSGARASKNRADSIYDRLHWCMKQAAFTDLPGIKWRAHVQKGADVLVLDQAPTAEIALKYPGLVKRETSYSWDTPAVEKHLAAALPFEYGRLRENSFVRFYVRKETS